MKTIRTAENFQKFHLFSSDCFHCSACMPALSERVGTTHPASLCVYAWITRVPATYACLRCSRQPWLWLGERVRVVPLEGPGQRLCGFPARGLTASGTAVTRSESRTDSKARENPCLTKQNKKKISKLIDKLIARQRFREMIKHLRDQGAQGRQVTASLRLPCSAD